MDLALLPLVRGMVLGAIIIQVLLATVLFRPVSAPLLRRANRLAERGARPIPELLRSEQVLRAIMLALAVLYLGFWWYLGTEAGAGFWARLGRRQG